MLLFRGTVETFVYRISDLLHEELTLTNKSEGEAGLQLGRVHRNYFGILCLNKIERLVVPSKRQITFQHIQTFAKYSKSNTYHHNLFSHFL